MGAIVRTEDWDVATRLAELGLVRDELIDVVAACVAGHAGCTDNDPTNARGYESWRWGVRALREIHRPKGWDKDDTEGYPTIINHKLRLRIAFMNSDDGAGVPDDVPQNKSRKGPNSERAAATNRQLSFAGPGWTSGESEGAPFDNYVTWHLCVYINGDEVRAELSVLNDFGSGYFRDFFEKIILLAPGDWNKLPFKTDQDDDGAPAELEIEVVRK